MNSEPPSAGRKALEDLLAGYRSTALLSVAAKLGVADLLQSGPRSSAELARSLGAHADSLHRVLRGLVALGVCAEEPDGRFSLTDLGAGLRTDSDRSLRSQAIVAGEEYLAAWGGLLHTVRTGETAFVHVFNMSPWEHRRRDPELSARFDADLNEETARAAENILAACDFSPFRVVCDVGGGRGALLAALLRVHLCVSGILYEQPHVLPAARSYLEEAEVLSRCTLVGGSFFNHVPDGADAYILKSVIHDWDDARSVVILRNCAGALNRGGRVLLVERLLPERVERDRDTVLMDVHMLAVTGGRERSEEDFRALLVRAGLALTRIIRTRSPFHVIEAVLADTEAG